MFLFNVKYYTLEKEDGKKLTEPKFLMKYVQLQSFHQFVHQQQCA